MTNNRPIHVIAADIRRCWPNVNYAAEPYLKGMEDLNKVDDTILSDDAKSVVLYFLSNARGWRGEHAKRIKAELKEMFGLR